MIIALGTYLIADAGVAVPIMVDTDPMAAQLLVRPTGAIVAPIFAVDSVEVWSAKTPEKRRNFFLVYRLGGVLINFNLKHCYFSPVYEINH